MRCRVVRSGAARRGRVADRRPDIDLVSTPEAAGEPLSFKFVVGVRPQAELGEYKGLEVGKEDKEVDEEIIDTEVDRIREGFARLEPVERAAKEGDAVLIDFEGFVDGHPFQGGKADDYLLTLGSGQLIDNFEEQLTGAESGRRGRGRGHLPGRLPGRETGRRRRGLQGRGQRGAGEILPELDDDFASDASEFDTLEELRGDIREKVGSALAAAPRKTSASPPSTRRSRRDRRDPRRHRHRAGGRTLGADGTSARPAGDGPQRVPADAGKTRDELIAESKPDAERELKREAVVTAIAVAENLEVSEEEMVEALEHSAEHERTTPEKLLARLRENGRDAVIREDLLARKAIELVAEQAKPIPLAEAEERKGKAEAAEKLLAPEGAGGRAETGRETLDSGRRASPRRGARPAELLQ